MRVAVAQLAALPAYAFQVLNCLREPIPPDLSKSATGTGPTGASSLALD